MNSRLRSAIQAARSANMPKDNIERAIDKSSIAAQSNYESIRYEGFGPAKTAVIVNTLTDNKNRTASNLRTIFQKHGGGLGTQGSASHNFLQQGIIKISKDEIDEEKIFNLATDAGANDCIFHVDYYEIHTNNNEIYDVKTIMEKVISNFISTAIEWVPVNKINLNKDDQEKMLKFLEVLEENDDVQNIFTNAI
jgi:DNA-binding regulatory protein, YebC/PmpR family